MDERFVKTRQAADAHFWYHGFRLFLGSALTDVAAGRTNLRIIDCGCGMGQNMPLLAPHGRVVGFELEQRAAAAGREFGEPIACADITRIPFPDDLFDLAVSFDVLQVVEPDMAAVREMARVVRPGGYVVLSVAALELLSGDHAEVWNEYRRYTPRTARELAESAGLRVERVSFAFACLFPLMLGVRTMQRLSRPFRGAPSHSDMEVPWAPLNAALMRLLDVEAAVSRYVAMPIGTSLIVVARKDDSHRVR
jgi:SAM-dependent methyltransferase